MPVFDGAATLEAAGGRGPAQAWRKRLDLSHTFHLPGLATPATVGDGVSPKVIRFFSKLAPSVKIDLSPCHWARTFSKLGLSLSQLGQHGIASLNCIPESWGLDTLF